ncbi:hypothetical protein CDEST_06532 [Colletotrichum destructivum]|uniref:Uncharacterized protein n=1 Tax=Colletotrichum destructivum TaxID=34406 RepID=A0AAX4IFE2_9PEZI|nr:hypothetical protein CDEST_06532 [Colletotrichum destructivum]
MAPDLACAACPTGPLQLEILQPAGTPSAHQGLRSWFSGIVTHHTPNVRLGSRLVSIKTPSISHTAGMWRDRGSGDYPVETGSSSHYNRLLLVTDALSADTLG